jgi:hypothetical protein
VERPGQAEEAIVAGGRRVLDRLFNDSGLHEQTPTRPSPGESILGVRRGLVVARRLGIGGKASLGPDARRHSSEQGAVVVPDHHPPLGVHARLLC